MKNELRKELKNKLKFLSKEEKNLYDLKINQDLINFIQKFTFKKIGLYVPIYNEVNIEVCFNFLIDNNYQVSLPIWNYQENKENTMDFVLLQEDNFKDCLLNLIPNSAFPSYLEPKFNENLLIIPDIIIIPCIGYNINKFRLGYGGGYYDIYLSKYKNIKTICLGYKMQEIGFIFEEEFDIKMDFIINEKTCF